MNAKYLKKISQSLLNLPTLPTMHAKLMEVIDHPNTTNLSLGNLISEDQVFTARLLKMANSAYYGLNHEVTDVIHAISLLGFDQVRELGIGMSVINQFENSEVNLSNLWEHSGVVGGVAKAIEEKYFQIKGNSFICGLLHDIGKVVLVQYIPEYIKVLAVAKEKKLPLYLLEQHLFEVDHGVVGAWLGEKWKLPEQVLNCMRYHHNTLEDPEKSPTLFCVWAANHLVKQIIPGKSGCWNQKLFDSDIEYLEYWGLTKEEFESWPELYSSDAENALELMRSLLAK
jgi:putative nucleotidyltransferase with HDIG domain